MCKKITFIVFFVLMFTNLFFVFNVSSAIISITDWEDIAAGTKSGTSGLFDFENTTTVSTDYWSVSTNWAISGTRSFRFGAPSGGATGGDGYLNLTSSYSYIENISFFLKWQGDGDAANNYIDFYNNTDRVLRLRYTNAKLYWYDVSTGWEQLSAIQDACFMTFYHNETNEFWVRMYDSVTLNLEQQFTLNSAIAENWATFTHISIDCNSVGGGNAVTMYIDDFNITYNPAGSGSGSDCNDGYDFIGLGKSSQYVDVDDEILELSYDIPFNGTVQGFEFYVKSTAYPVGYHPELWIEGDYIGEVDNIIDEGSFFTLQWCNINQVVDSNNIVYEIRQDTQVTTDIYYQLYIWNNIDNDGDGTGTVHVHNSDTQLDGNLDGSAIVGGLYDVYDLCYKMYYELGDYTGSTGGDIVDTTDDFLSFTGEGYLGLHPDYDIDNFYQWTPVIISYNVQTLAQQNVMHIYYEGSWDDIGQTQGFPMDLNIGSSTVSFTPYNIGNYTVTIDRPDGTEKVNETFYSYMYDPDFHIYTVPAFTTPLRNYQVHYFINSTDVCYIGCFDTVEHCSDWDYALYKRYLGTGDSTGSFSFNGLPDLSTHYWRIFMLNGTDYIPVGDIHAHPIITDSLSNYINIPIIETGSQVYINEVFAIAYGHAYPLGDVGIYLNSNKIFDVGLDVEGYRNYMITRTGFYNLSLRVRINDTLYILDSLVFTVGEQVDDSSGGDDDIVDPDQEQWNYLAGFGVIIGCIVIPLGIFKNNRMASANASLLIVVFATLGLGISIMWELLPFWFAYLYALICVGILFLAFLFKRG